MSDSLWMIHLSDSWILLSHNSLRVRDFWCYCRCCCNRIPITTDFTTEIVSWFWLHLIRHSLSLNCYSWVIQFSSTESFKRTFSKQWYFDIHIVFLRLFLNIDFISAHVNVRLICLDGSFNWFTDSLICLIQNSLMRHVHALYFVLLKTKTAKSCISDCIWFVRLTV